MHLGLYNEVTMFPSLIEINMYYLIDIQIEKLQALLQDAEVSKINFSDFEPLPLPLDPDIKVNAIDPESASLFKVSVNGWGIIVMQKIKKIINLDTIGLCQGKCQNEIQELQFDT